MLVIARGYELLADHAEAREAAKIAAEIKESPERLQCRFGS